LIWDRGAALPEGRVQRRLAAILAADVAGYSRLMGADEVGTLAVFLCGARSSILQSRSIMAEP